MQAPGVTSVAKQSGTCDHFAIRHQTGEATDACFGVYDHFLIRMLKPDTKTAEHRQSFGIQDHLGDEFYISNSDIKCML